MFKLRLRTETLTPSALTRDHPCHVPGSVLVLLSRRLLRAGADRRLKVTPEERLQGLRLEQADPHQVAGGAARISEGRPRTIKSVASEADRLLFPPGKAPAATSSVPVLESFPEQVPFSLRWPYRRHPPARRVFLRNVQQTWPK